MKSVNLRNSITIGVAAELLGISRQAMHKMIEKKKLKSQRFSFAPHMILLDRDEILKLADKRKRKEKK